MTLTTANAHLEPGWKIVRQGQQYALLWQGQRARARRYQMLAVGTLHEMLEAYKDLTRPLPGGQG
jgi:hypothetical protein